MFIVYDKTGLCHYWGSIFRALWFVSYSACFMTHVQCLSLSQVESEGFPLAGWGNDDRVPIVSSINFVISHSSFFIPRWKSPLWTQFRFLTWLVHPVLAPGHSLGLDQIWWEHVCCARALEPWGASLSLWPYPLYPALHTLDEYAPWSRPSNGIPWRPYLV